MQILRCRYLILLLLYQELAFGNVTQELVFYPDVRQIDIPAVGPECTPLLDNTSNFNLERSSDKVTITAQAANATRGLLIVTCGAETRFYTLRYINVRKNEIQNDAQGFFYQHPQSFLDLEYTQMLGNSPSGSIGLTDLTYQPLQVTALRRYTDLHNKDLTDTSIDFDHIFDDRQIGYGFSENYLLNGSTRSYRTRAGLGGFSANLNLIESTTDPYTTQFILASPMPIGLIYRRNQQFPETDQSLQRTFFYSISRFSQRLNLTYGRVDNANTSDLVERGEVVSTTFYRWLPFITTGEEVGYLCVTDQRCQVNRIALTPEVRFRGLTVFGRISFVPHQYQMLALYQLTRVSQIGFTYTRVRPSIPYFVSQDWVLAEESSEDSANALNFSRLEYRLRSLSLFVENSQPIYPEEAVVNSSYRTGFRKELRHWEFGASYQIAMSKSQNNHTVMANVRRYIQNNIADLALQSKSHSIRGTVLSKFTREPLQDAKVKLFLDGQEIGEFSTGEDGKFIFKDVATTGDYELRVQSGQYQGNKKFRKSRSQVERDLDVVVEDRLEIRVEFYVDSNSDGLYDQDDKNLNISNFDPLVGEAIAINPKAKYQGNLIFLPLADRYQLEINHAFLPLRYKAIIDTIEGVLREGESKVVVKILLRPR